VPGWKAGKAGRAAEKPQLTSDEFDRETRTPRWPALCESVASFACSSRTAAGAGEGIRTLDFNLGKVALYP
jgi:hypothetical protein